MTHAHLGDRVVERGWYRGMTRGSTGVTGRGGPEVMARLATSRNRVFSRRKSFQLTSRDACAVSRERAPTTLAILCAPSSRLCGDIPDYSPKPTNCSGSYKAPTPGASSR